MKAQFNATNKTVDFYDANNEVVIGWVKWDDLYDSYKNHNHIDKIYRLGITEIEDVGFADILGHIKDIEEYDAFIKKLFDQDYELAYELETERHCELSSEYQDELNKMSYEKLRSKYSEMIVEPYDELAAEVQGVEDHAENIRDILKEVFEDSLGEISNTDVAMDLLASCYNKLLKQYANRTEPEDFFEEDNTTPLGQLINHVMSDETGKYEAMEIILSERIGQDVKVYDYKIGEVIRGDEDDDFCQQATVYLAFYNEWDDTWFDERTCIIFDITDTFAEEYADGDEALFANSSRVKRLETYYNLF